MDIPTRSTGLLLINKSSGPTSHDMVYKLRKITGIKKIGHAGTLDPFASGLMIMAIGRETTKTLADYIGMDKEYIATVKLGLISSTLDRTGIITDNLANPIKEEFILNELSKIVGTHNQIPPMHSAKKVGGKKLYKLARKGIEIVREPKLVNIYHIEEINYSWPLLTFNIKVSSGTYIRSIADDLGKSLGCGALLEELQRISINNYSIKDAAEVDRLNPDNWQSYLI
jgi:tRNA pseudouridine55 synthase